MMYKNHKALWLIVVLFVILISVFVSANADESDTITIEPTEPVPSMVYYPDYPGVSFSIHGGTGIYYYSVQREAFIDNEWIVTDKTDSSFVITSGSSLGITIGGGKEATKVKAKLQIRDTENHTAEWDSGVINVERIEIPMEADTYTIMKGQTAFIQYPYNNMWIIVQSSPEGIAWGYGIGSSGDGNGSKPDGTYDSVITIKGVQSGITDVTIMDLKTDFVKRIKITVLEELNATGWIEKKGKWYYGDANQRPLTGMAEIDGFSYIFSETGEMRTGWVEFEGKWYYAQNSGALYNNGWLKIDDTWYFFKTNGEMATGWVFDGYAWYYMNSNGTMTTGWIEDEDKWYYMDDNGTMKTGWVKLDNTWYLLRSTGEMASGWEYLYGKWYYFSSSGAMVTGWQNIEGVWYSFSDSGTMRTGWYEDNTSNWYWFDQSGVMVTGWKEINGKWEMFADSGLWLYTWDGQ